MSGWIVVELLALQAAQSIIEFRKLADEVHSLRPLIVPLDQVIDAWLQIAMKPSNLM